MPLAYLADNNGTLFRLPDLAVMFRRAMHPGFVVERMARLQALYNFC
jgi:hypothetical protein